MLCNWKEASSLILTAVKKTSFKNGINYSLLALKRACESSFVPNSYVFPGGVTHSIDSNEEWLNIFYNHGVNVNVDDVNNLPPLIKGYLNTLPKSLVLKITAIRETFEETGILLCVTNKGKSSNDKWVSCSKFEGLNEWRIKVQNDGAEFLNLCHYYKCCPDVQNLSLWSNWLTPANAGNKRFDTAFFLAFLKESCSASPDGKEIESLCWTTPSQLIEKFKKKDISLPPPQLYEASRLGQFKDVELFRSFAFSRNKKGCERWVPVQLKAADGLISLLPGDDAYKTMNFGTLTQPFELGITIKEFRFQYRVLHRIEFPFNSSARIIVENYQPTCGHLLPAPMTY